ncbi:hypothetical protein K449DRAFT_242664 [Hypoxylon sp. EC38]|nr:hypothetical protein K449DRAFT_242664 [Hypoxylon sp. EC38]
MKIIVVLEIFPFLIWHRTFFYIISSISQHLDNFAKFPITLHWPERQCRAEAITITIITSMAIIIIVMIISITTTMIIAMEENEHEYINGRCVNCGEPEFPQGGHHVGQIVNGRCTNCGERHPSARSNRSTRNNRDNRDNRNSRNNRNNQGSRNNQSSQNSQNSRNNQNSRPDADMGQRLRDELQRWQNLHATARSQNRNSYLFCDEHMRYHFGDNYAHFTPAQYMDLLATAVAIGGEQQNGASNNENRDPHSNWDHDSRQGH